MFTYRKSDKLEVIGYTDFDFIGHQNSMKLISDYIYLLTGGTISLKRSKQSLITFSTMITEFIIYYETSNHRI